jgi:hypothetical protein
MSMQALNQLVARSIIDPSIVQAFSAGDIRDVLGELNFIDEFRERLYRLKADTWTEFAILAYRLVKVSEPRRAPIELPSPAEGLVTEEVRLDKEQVA